MGLAPSLPVVWFIDVYSYFVILADAGFQCYPWGGICWKYAAQATTTKIFVGKVNASLTRHCESTECKKNIPNEETVPKITKASGGICAVTMAAQWLLFTSMVFLAVWYGYTQVVNPKAWVYIYQLSTSKAFPTIPAWHMTWYDSYCSWLALVVGDLIIQPWLFAVNSCYHLMSSTKIEQLATIRYNYSLVN